MKYIFIFLLLPFVTAAQSKTTDPFYQKALVLKRFFDKNHYQPLKWDDSASAMLYDHWLNDLDNERLFFTQKDINIFEKYRTTLDDEMEGKGLSFFVATSNAFRSGLKHADSVIQSFLSKPVDFFIADSVSWPNKNFAANEKESALRWQRYLKWQILDNIVDKLTADNDSFPKKMPSNFAGLEIAERLRTKKRESNYIKALLATPEKFIYDIQNNYLNAIAWCYDPHSNYMNTKSKDEFTAEVSAMEYSAGFSLEENDRGDKTIDFLEPGGSAWSSGQLHKGDVLVKVKKNETETDAEDISAESLSGLLNSSTKDDIEVTVRTSAGEIKKVKLIQEKISAEEGIVKSYVIKRDKNIGYINLPGFYSREEEGAKESNYNGCANDISKEIIKLKKENIEGLILDLRNNGGGSMWEAIQLAGIFIDAGPVASVKEKDGKVLFMKDPNRGTIYDGPMVILINGASASASEFFSAALQDYNRAVIVGSTSYGKGTAQVVVPLDTNKADPYKKYDDFVKITERKFYRINGNTVQWTGVEPDISLPDMYSNIYPKEKINVSALKPDLSRKGVFEASPLLPISELRAKSAERVKNNKYFKFIEQLNQKVKKTEEINIFPLQFSKYISYRKKISDKFTDIKALKTGDLTNLNVDNNAFDKERIALSGKQTIETNKSYLENISNDTEIEEVCNILSDLRKNK